MDVTRGEMVEAESDRLIQKRAEVEDPEAKEALWLRSVERYNASRVQEMRAVWCEYHREQAARLRAILENLIARHDAAAKSCQPKGAAPHRPGGRGVADAPMRRYKAGRWPLCCGSWGGADPLLRPRPRPFQGAQAQRLAGGGRSKGQGELGELKKRIKDLAAGVLDGTADRGRAAVANQLYNTLIRAIEQERKQRELEEMAERLEALEEVLKGRKGA